jgi:diguanylate cyclase (GGDEF)-like protein
MGAEATRVARMESVERFFPAIAGAVSSAVLIAWMAPGFARHLPPGWPAMKASTALAALLSAVSLEISREPRKGDGWKSPVALVLALGVAALGASCLVEYIFHVSLGVDELMAFDPRSNHPGCMSPQTATGFLLLGVTMALGARLRGAASCVADLMLLSLCLLLLLVTAGYVFGVLRLFGLSMGNKVSPQTLMCLALLASVVLRRRSKEGFFAILRGNGIGGHIARFASPIALAVPFLLEGGRQWLMHDRLASENYATALASALASICAFSLVLLLAWRIDGLEEQLRELSLRDDLTKLYNRKGFFAAAARSLQEAQTLRSPFSVLFIDLDNLKTINDTFGHEAGSRVLCDMADHLQKSFRKRDVIGRIGGDEFVVACECSEWEVVDAARRLEASVTGSNSGRRHPLSFSFGHVTAEGTKDESLEHMLAKADALMYEVKRCKKGTDDANDLPAGQLGRVAMSRCR